MAPGLAWQMALDLLRADLTGEFVVDMELSFASGYPKVTQSVVSILSHGLCNDLDDVGYLGYHPYFRKPLNGMSIVIPSKKMRLKIKRQKMHGLVSRTSSSVGRVKSGPARCSEFLVVDPPLSMFPGHQSIESIEFIDIMDL